MVTGQFILMDSSGQTQGLPTQAHLIQTPGPLGPLDSSDLRKIQTLVNQISPIQIHPTQALATQTILIQTSPYSESPNSDPRPQLFSSLLAIYPELFRYGIKEY